jgi:DNA-binding NarL/FixJ family response regulator
MTIRVLLVEDHRMVREALRVTRTTDSNWPDLPPPM